jgi:integrase
VKFPVTIRHRSARVRIYAPARNFGYYRVCWTAAGKNHRRTFKTYSEAKEHAERLARELARGEQSTALSTREATDALAIRAVLDGFYRDTGRRVTALEALKGYVDALRKLREHTLEAAVAGFLASAASIRRKDLGEAVAEFLQAREPLTRSANGERPQLSGKYAYNLEIQLRRFAGTFPGTAVCDLTKDHLDAFLGALDDFTAKTRNHHRAAVRHFLQWCVRKDYLAPTHRLGEADGLRPEKANRADAACYTAQEFRRLLEAAEDPLRVMIALGGLAGLRTAELLRLDWADVWRVPGHIEITSGKAKTRQRRLVEICPALAAWLEPFRTFTAGKLCTLHEITFQQHVRELCERIKLPRKANGLRHSFCTYHFALHANENLTAQQAGNSPNMIHAHYRGLATKKEAEAWFAVRPAPAANNIVLLPQERCL